MDVLNLAVHLSKLCAKFGWNCVTGDTYAILSFFPTLNCLYCVTGDTYAILSFFPPSESESSLEDMMALDRILRRCFSVSLSAF